MRDPGPQRPGAHPDASRAALLPRRWAHPNRRARHARGRRAIEKPADRSLRAHHAGRQLRVAAGPGSKDPRYGSGLLRAFDQEQDLSGGRECRQGEAQPWDIGRVARARYGDDHARSLPEGRRSGKERGGVTVRPEPEEHGIEARGRPRGRRAPDETRVVFGRLGRGPKLSSKAMDLSTGNRYMSEQRLPRHGVIALGVPRAHAPLVPKEDLRFFPREARAPPTCEELVEGLGGAAAREHPGEPTARSDGRSRLRGEVACQCFGFAGRIGKDPDLPL